MEIIGISKNKRKEKNSWTCSAKNVIYGLDGSGLTWHLICYKRVIYFSAILSLIPLLENDIDVRLSKLPCVKMELLKGLHI